MLFYDSALNFASVGDNNNLWGPIMEKAFAKVKGTYAHANGGFVPNGLRSLLGSPIFDNVSEDQTSYSDVWTTMKAADDLNYILGAGTFGSDTLKN